MRKIFFVILHVCTVTVSCFSSDLQAFFSYATYNVPDQKPYIETYLTILGDKSALIRKENGSFVPSYSIVMLFKQDGKIQNFKKYTLIGQPLTDTSIVLPNLVDLQRIPVAQGNYNFELTISLTTDTLNSFRHVDIISVFFPDAELSFSGVQLLEKFTKTKEVTMLSKNGFDLTPYVSNFLPENIDTMMFYFELYGSDMVFKDHPFLVKSFLMPHNGGTELADYGRVVKKAGANVIPILGAIPIHNLPSGNYDLVLEVRDNMNEVMASKSIFVQRSNPRYAASILDLYKEDSNNSFTAKYNDRDSLMEYLRCLRPISDNQEIMHAQNLIALGNVDYMRNYFHEFWVKRNEVAPEFEWGNYNFEVKKVNTAYSTQIQKGYETDRGRVYLQYGPPNNIEEAPHDNNTYPYEIWQYVQVKNQSNKRFVFWNPNVYGGGFELLHSDVIGEIRNPNWQRMLTKRVKPASNYDEQEGLEHSGTSIEDRLRK